ncbi:small, acid-soluble spore protein K [Bacillus tianshenii]|nr:small, acid-soluble spore protein K [Bacillus tianshenii]
MRNKEQGFPPRISLNGEPRAKAEYASKRANGTINTNPQQRMRRSNQEFGEQG